MRMSNKISKDLTRRTSGEELWIARKAAGLTQVEAARRAGVGETAYLAAEKDRNPPRIASVPGISRVRAPSLGALLALARRRSGLGLGGVAAGLRVTKVTVLTWERAGDYRLRNFWTRRGYGFG